jgi:hypothetical protein
MKQAWNRVRPLLPPAFGWFRRLSLLAVEVLLVLAILGLLAAIWMPALIGARPGSAH